MKKLPLFAAMSVLLSGNTFAGGMGPVHYDPNGIVLALSLGPAWVQKNDTQSFYVAPDLLKTYTVSDHTGTVPFGEVFLGYKTHFVPDATTVLGISVGAVGKTTTNGYVYDDGDPRFTNQSYTSEKQTTFVLAKAQLISKKTIFGKIKPFIEGGIGAGRNRVSNYANTSIVCGVAADPNFQNNSEWNFGYEVGGGILTSITDKIDLSIGVDWVDFGTTSFGTAPGEQTGSVLDTKNAFIGLFGRVSINFDSVDVYPASPTEPKVVPFEGTLDASSVDAAPAVRSKAARRAATETTTTVRKKNVP